MRANGSIALIPGVTASLGAALLTGVVVEGHQGVGYLICCRFPAGVGQAIEHPWRCRWIIVLNGRWFGHAGQLNL